MAIKAVEKSKKRRISKSIEKVVVAKVEPVSVQPVSAKYIEAVGRRKTSIARVRLYIGKVGFEVNGKNYKDYFTYPFWQQIVEGPLQQLQPTEKFGISVKVSGGGINSQAEAVRHGLARALVKLNEGYRKQLRKLGYITRDPRMKERRKYGLKKARRAPQWSKR